MKVKHIHVDARNGNGESLNVPTTIRPHHRGEIVPLSTAQTHPHTRGAISPAIHSFHSFFAGRLTGRVLRAQPLINPVKWTKKNIGEPNSITEVKKAARLILFCASATVTKQKLQDSSNAPQIVHQLKRVLVQPQYLSRFLLLDLLMFHVTWYR